MPNDSTVNELQRLIQRHIRNGAVRERALSLAEDLRDPPFSSCGGLDPLADVMLDRWPDFDPGE